MRRFDRLFLEPDQRMVNVAKSAAAAAGMNWNDVMYGISEASSQFKAAVVFAAAREAEAIRRRKLGDELLGYPVHIDPTIGDGPDIFPCPPPRPAGAPAAEAHTPDDAPRH
jgi:hypothetical protein